MEAGFDDEHNYGFARLQLPESLFTYLLRGLAQAINLCTQNYDDEGEAIICYIDIRAIDQIDDIHQAGHILQGSKHLHSWTSHPGNLTIAINV